MKESLFTTDIRKVFPRNTGARTVLPCIFCSFQDSNHSKTALFLYAKKFWCVLGAKDNLESWKSKQNRKVLNIGQWLAQNFRRSKRPEVFFRVCGSSVSRVDTLNEWIPTSISGKNNSQVVTTSKLRLDEIMTATAHNIHGFQVLQHAIPQHLGRCSLHGLPWMRLSLSPQMGFFTWFVGLWNVSVVMGS